MNTDRQAGLDGLVGRSAAEFTRHAGSMLLLDRLVEISPTKAVCTWRVPRGHPLFELKGGVPVYVSIECMAQCVAVHAGAQASLKGLGPPLGLLLGTRQFVATQDRLMEGVEYRISSRELVRDNQGLASFDCTICYAKSTIASCRLAVFEALPGNEPVA